MKGINGFTTLLPTTAASNPGFMNRLDLISVTILGSIIVLCTLICCCVGLKRRKVLPNESQFVDVHHSHELDQSNNTFGTELRHPQSFELRIREPRTPDSPPPTYSVLERQTSFTSSISQSSSQIELPPNYEEATGLARHSLMSTLIPEEGVDIVAVVDEEVPRRRSESAHRNQQQTRQQKRTYRSKSDIEKTRRSRSHHATALHSPPIEASAIIESTASPPDLLRKPLGTPGSDVPLLTPRERQEPKECLGQVRPSSDSTAAARVSPCKPKMTRSSTDV